MKEYSYLIYYRPTGNVVSEHNSIPELVKAIQEDLYVIREDLDVEVVVTTRRKIQIPSELSE